MTNLTEKIDELQIQLATQHGAMMVALNALVADSAYIKLSTAETVAKLTETNTTLAYMRDEQLPRLTAIDTKLSNIYTRLADIKAATENSAISDAANTVALTALDNRVALSNILLDNIAQCSCNGGQPIPISAQCAGDYRRITTTTVPAGVDADANQLFLNGNFDSIYTSWISDVVGHNQIENMQIGGNFYSATKTSVIVLQPGDTWCIENTGTQWIDVAVASNPVGSSWTLIRVNPGAFQTLTRTGAQGAYGFLVGGRIINDESDAFKPQLFFSHTDPVGGDLLLVSQVETIRDVFNTPYIDHIIVWPSSLGTPHTAKIGGAITSTANVFLDVTRAYTITKYETNVFIDFTTGVTVDSVNPNVWHIEAGAIDVLVYRPVAQGQFTILVQEV